MTPEEITGGGAAKASWESLQQGALDHYEELATRAHHWSSFVPAAIKAYKDPDNPNPFLDWLNNEIIKSIKLQSDQDYDPEAVALCQGHIDAYSLARTKFLTIQYPSQPIDTQETDDKNFVNGLE
jgi:hypothetical protein